MKKFLIIVSLLSLSAPAFARYKINAITGRLDRVDGSTTSSGGNFILNTNVLQSGSTFYTSSGTIDTGGLRIHGLLDIDRPTLHGPFDNTARMKFDPSSSGALLNLYSYNGIAPSIGVQALNSNEAVVGSLIWTIATGSAFSLRASSCATCTPQIMFGGSGQSGETSVSDNQGTVFFTFNTSSTGIKGARPIVFYDSNSSNFVGFKASDTVAANSVWTLPDADGTSGQAIITDGNKNLSFGSVASGASSTSNVLQFASTQSASVGATLAETTVVGGGVGTLTFPAGLFTNGYTFRVQAKGSWEGAEPITIRLKLGGVTIGDSSAPNTLGASGMWNYDALVTIRSTGAAGSLFQQSYFFPQNTGGDTYFDLLNTSTSAVNTTIANTLDLTAEWGTAIATITCTNLLVDGLATSTSPITIGGVNSTLEVFSNFDGITSSPTPSISFGDSLKISLVSSTPTVTVDFSSVASRGDTLDKEFWWPAAATQPLEAGADNVPPIVSTAGVHMDLLTTDFDSATDECRDVNFGVSTQSLVNVTTVTFTAYSFSASTGSGNFGWYFAHNSGIGGSSLVSVATSTVSSAFVAVNPTRSGLNITSWDASLSSLGWIGGDWVEGLFCRDANNASDTMSGDLKAIAFSIILKKDR